MLSAAGVGGGGGAEHFTDLFKSGVNKLVDVVSTELDGHAMPQHGGLLHKAVLHVDLCISCGWCYRDNALCVCNDAVSWADVLT